MNHLHSFLPNPSLPPGTEAPGTLSPCPALAPVTHLKELIDFAKVDSLLGIQFVNVTDISIHQVEAKAHHLE